MALAQATLYTVDDIYALPEGQRAELIDGQLYMIHNYLEPDISVICDKEKLDEKGYHGAPDWVIEITSPSDPQRDYGIKLFKYRNTGVREYWIVNPQKHTVTVFDFETEKRSNQYSFDDNIPVCIYENFILNISKLLRR